MSAAAGCALLVLSTTWVGGLVMGGVGVASTAGIAGSFGAQNTSGSATLSASPSIATTAGDLLVAAIRTRNVTAMAPVSSVADSNPGDRWLRASAVTQGSQADGEIWYAAGAASLATSQAVTVTVGGTSAAKSAIAFTVLELTGVAASPLDAAAVKAGNTEPASSGTTRVTSQASEIAVADIGWNSSVTASAQSAGYTTLQVEQAPVSGSAAGEQAAWRLLTTTGTQSYSATLSSGTVAWTGLIVTFKVGAVSPPTISSFSPISGAVGTPVTIIGTGFTGATAVLFNNTAAGYTVTDDSHISTAVPAGAGSGPITVTAPGGSVTSTDSFTVTAPSPPTISSFSPISGAVGTPVTIIGTGFTGATAVLFKNTAASYTVTDDSHISTAVPAGAGSGPITVTAPGGSVTSTTSFSVNSSPNPIQHIVVLYQENHSFDNVLGAWCAQTGRCLGLPSTVTLKGGVVVTPAQAPDLVPSMGHSVTDQVNAMDGGKMDGWAGVSNCQASSSPAYACVSYFSPAQVPNIVALASAFVVSDRTFSMADSPSFGGHMYAVAASTDRFNGNNPHPHTGVTPGQGWGCDSNLDAAWAPSPGAALQQVPSCVPDPNLDPTAYPFGGAYRATPVADVPTIMDRLKAAGLSWRLYTSAVSSPGGKGSGGAYNWAICPTFAECLDTSDRMNMVPTSNFLTDAKNGTLPSFSIVLPQGSGSLPTSQHNGTSMAAGDNWIGQVATAVEQSPEWRSTALFITYDDCGCFYDHVAPGVNPDGTQQGIRIPLVIVSPWARAGYTDSTPATFASILAFTEQTFGLAPLGVNDAGAYAFSNSFNFGQAPLHGVNTVQQPVLATGTVAQDPNDPT